MWRVCMCISNSCNVDLDDIYPFFSSNLDIYHVHKHSWIVMSLAEFFCMEMWTYIPWLPSSLLFSRYHKIFFIPEIVVFKYMACSETILFDNHSIHTCLCPRLETWGSCCFALCFCHLKKLRRLKKLPCCTELACPTAFVVSLFCLLI